MYLPHLLFPFERSIKFYFYYYFFYSNSLAFASEPVFTSLANVLGNCERMPTPIPTEIKVMCLFVTLIYNKAVCRYNVCLATTKNKKCYCYERYIVVEFIQFHFHYEVPKYLSVISKR